MSGNSYGGMSHEQLQEMRQNLAWDDPMQGALGPAEHRAFAREMVQGDPKTAIALSGMIPGYQAAKWIGRGGLGPLPSIPAKALLSAFGPKISQPSLSQMLGGYRGILEGFKRK